MLLPLIGSLIAQKTCLAFFLVTLLRALLIICFQYNHLGARSFFLNRHINKRKLHPTSIVARFPVSPRKKMSKKTVLITGCSAGGLGYALVKAFQEAKYHVFATARNPVTIGSFAFEVDIEILQLDVTSQESIAACLTEVRKKTDGRLDILVNNAGGAVFGPLIHASIPDVKGIYDVNVWGTLAVAQAFAPLLYEAQGVMLNISSMAGAVPLAWQGKDAHL